MIRRRSVSLLVCLTCACGDVIGIEQVTRDRPAPDARPTPKPRACAMCGDACIDIAKDPSNCGGCGRVCASGSCLGALCDRRMRGGPGARSLCVRGDDGVLRCRGANDRGQLGRGAASPPSPDFLPFDADPTAAFAVTDGLATCALGQDGAVRCVGGNVHGELGGGSPEAPDACDGGLLCSFAPVTAALVGTATDVVAGGGVEQIGYLCARLDDGSLSCWGRGATKFTPTVRLVGARAVAAGGSFVCALAYDGSVVCFGSVVGLGGGAESFDTVGLSVEPAGFPKADVLGAGGEVVCGAGGDGLVCMGGNGRGQVGAGDATKAVLVTSAVAIPDPGSIVQIAGGAAHTCALGADGRVWCWGASGTVGDGSSEDDGASCVDGPCRPAPVQVDVAEVVEIAAGATFTVARRRDGSLVGWGLGDPTTCVLADADGCATEAWLSPRPLATP